MNKWYEEFEDEELVDYREKWYEKFHDQEFTDYYESGEATVVHVVRDLAMEVNTKGKWIDVLSMNTFEPKSPQFEGHLGFNWIIVELFPRIQHPVYTVDREYNRYLTWQAAHEDIAKHRAEKHQGEKFLVLCKLKKVKHVVINEKNEKEERELVDYVVIDSCKVNQKQINTIESNADEIVKKIRAKRKPSLTLFPI